MFQPPIQQITKECFSALSRIRELPEHNLPMPNVLHDRLRQRIDLMSAEATRLGIPREDVYDITYAMVAHADEIALNASDGIRNYWMQQPLQLHYFHETNAGEGFFTRLQTVRVDPRRVEVLRVFYLCLLFGFQGSHRIRGGEIQLLTLQEELRYEIARTEPRFEVLSPRWQRPEEAIAGKRGGFPIVLAGVGTLVLAIGLLFTFRSMLASDVDALSTKVDVLMAPSQQSSQGASDSTSGTPAKAPTPGAEFGGETLE